MSTEDGRGSGAVGSKPIGMHGGAVIDEQTDGFRAIDIQANGQRLVAKVLGKHADTVLTVLLREPVERDQLVRVVSPVIDVQVCVPRAHGEGPRSRGDREHAPVADS